MIDQEKTPEGVSKLLVSGFDDNYVWPWIVHVFSGQKSGHQFTNRAIARSRTSLSHQNRELVEHVAEWLKFSINWIDIELPEGLPVSAHFTPMVYARLVLADSLSSPFIWMDADTLLLKKWESIMELPDLTKGFVSSAVLEKNPALHKDTVNEAMLRAGESYFNSGIMLIDPIVWRKNQLDVQWPILIKEYTTRKFQFLDQCILNYMLVGLNEPLPERFNFMPDKWGDTSTEPFIVHYASGNKPWIVPKLERNRALNAWRGTTSTLFPLYWNTERELIAAAKYQSGDLADRLSSLRDLVRKPADLSLRRVARITRRLTGSK